MEITANINNIELSIELDGDVTPVNIDDNTSYPINEYITFTPTILKNGSVFSNFTASYSVLDPNVDNVNIDEIDNNFSFTLNLIGNYLVLISIIDTDDNQSYSLSYTIEACNFITIEQSECETFTLNNNSTATDITVQVLDLFSADGESQVPLYNTIVVPEGQLSLDLSEVSLYTVNVTYTLGYSMRTESYIINNYCVIEECIAKYIQDILCEDTRECVQCPDTIELNRMLALNYAYFLSANAEYSMNNFYTGLNFIETQDKFSDMKSTMDKLVEYCNRRNCTGMSGSSITTSNNTSKKSNCGCNG